MAKKTAPTPKIAAATSFAEPSMYPLHRCKILHAVRHGQGFHNIAGDKDLKQYESWDFMDASLSELGWQQAESLHEHMVKTHIRNHIELVVVSPLLRTLQTAVGVWGGGTLLAGEPPHSALMAPGVGQYQHLPVSSAGCPPFVANEWCREQNGVHPCDKRSTVSSYKANFPAIDFTQIETDEDTWWHATNRETQVEILTRARVFLKWILDRTETRISVVSHSSFLYHLVHLFGEDCSDVVRKELQTGFRNCEMRSFLICDRRATAVSKAYNTDFRGGLFFNNQVAIEKAGKDGSMTRVGKQKQKHAAETNSDDEIDGDGWFQVANPNDLATGSRKASRRDSHADEDESHEGEDGDLK